MHQIEETSYGYRLTFDGFMNRDDMQVWFNDMKKAVGGRSNPYGVFVDLRGAVAFPAEAQEVLFQGIGFCIEHGMERNAIVFSNAIAKIQASRISKEAGMADKAVFLDASATTDWEEKAEEFLIHGTRPG